MYAIYFVTFTIVYHQYTPVMLAYIPAPAGSVMGIYIYIHTHAHILCILQKNKTDGGAGILKASEASLHGDIYI